MNPFTPRVKSEVASRLQATIPNIVSLFSRGDEQVPITGEQLETIVNVIYSLAYVDAILDASDESKRELREAMLEAAS